MIRLTIPSIEEDDLQAVRNALASGYLVQGAEVSAFEQSIAEKTGVRHGIAVSNCTAALHLALLALDVRPGDLVPVTAYSWISTANVIELCNAQPVFLDIEPDTFNLDPERLAETLVSLMSTASVARRVKAVLAADIFGQMADFTAIQEVARRYDLPVVEDAACSLGASLDGIPAGSWGVMGCFSFHPRKAVTTGEGGVVTTNDDRLARTVRALRNHGMDPEAPAPDFTMPGFNYRMTEFQAALGRTQLAKLGRHLESRRRLAANYNRLLHGTAVEIPAAKRGNETHVYQSYVVLLPHRATQKRTVLIQTLREQGIETTIGTWHMPMTRYFQNRYGFRKGDFPVADGLFERALTLPLFETMVPEQQDEVVRKLLKAIETI